MSGASPPPSPAFDIELRREGGRRRAPPGDEGEEHKDESEDEELEAAIREDARLQAARIRAAKRAQAARDELQLTQRQRLLEERLQFMEMQLEAIKHKRRGGASSPAEAQADSRAGVASASPHAPSNQPAGAAMPAAKPFAGTMPAAAAASPASPISGAVAASDPPSEPFMQQSLARRRSEVYAWSPREVRGFLSMLGHQAFGEEWGRNSARGGVDGEGLWIMGPHAPEQYVTSAADRAEAAEAGMDGLVTAASVRRAVNLMRDHGDHSSTPLGRLISCVVSIVRLHKGFFDFLYPPGDTTTGSSAVSGGTASSGKRAAANAAEERRSKRARFAAPAEVSFEEPRWANWRQQHKRKKKKMDQRASGGCSAPAALYHELPSFDQDATRVSPLKMDLLPRRWFVREVPGALICPVCGEVVRDPPNLETCGHAVCRDCLNGVRRHSSLCPVCRTSFACSTLASQPFAQSMVWQLRVRCVQHEKGCRWQGRLGVEAHNLQEHDAVCPFKEATCVLCDETHLVKDMQGHRANCPRRAVTCASCHERVCLSDMPLHQPAMMALGDVDAAPLELRVTRTPMDTSDNPTSSIAPTSLAAAASCSSSSISVASVAGASSGSGAIAAPLLPPLVPPCSASVVCPLGCEDPRYPGHVWVYRLSLRQEHERTCGRRSSTCTLCFPTHLVAPLHLDAHIASVLSDPQRQEYAQRQIKQYMQHGQAWQAQ